MIVSGYLFETEDCLDLLVFTCCFQQAENVPAGALVCSALEQLPLVTASLIRLCGSEPEREAAK